MCRWWKMCRKEDIQKWKEWLTNSIFLDIDNLFITRYLYKSLLEILENNPKVNKPNHFYNFIQQGYTTNMLMMIRRQCKNDTDSISLARVLAEIHKCPNLLSLDYYVNLYQEKELFREILTDYPKNRFSEIYAGKTKKYIDPDIVLQDINRLTEKFDKLVHLIDRRVAHYDLREPEKMPTFDEMGECVDLLIELFHKYHELIFGYSSSFGPNFQYNWKQIFEEPWIPQNKKESI